MNRSRLRSLPATKNIGDSEDGSDAKIFSVPDYETDQQSAPDIQLEMPRQGNAASILVENNFSTTSVSQGDQSLRQYFYKRNV